MDVLTVDSKTDLFHGWKPLPHGIETTVINESCDLDRFSSKCVVAPIVTSGIFIMDSVDGLENDNASQRSYRHSRRGNPTRDVVENCLSKLEGSKYALSFASGSAAINTVLQTLLNQGDHVVSMKTVYGGLYYLLNDFGRFGVSVDFEPSFDAEKIAALVRPNTKMIWLETPANPTLRLIDIENTVHAARKKQKDVIVVVDNTFLTPVFQRPLELGADISLYSCSKYLGGHTDIVMGSIAMDSEDIFLKLRKAQEATGAVPSPFDCYLLIRSLKTLPLRMYQHFKTGLAVAKYLETQEKVEKVVHPGLTSHPQHKLALKQQSGHSGAVGIYLKGEFKESSAFLNAVKLIRRAPSLGTDMSVANIPSRGSHADFPLKDRESVGITDNFIRLSLGLESAESIIEDLEQAFKLI